MTAKRDAMTLEQVVREMRAWRDAQDYPSAQLNNWAVAIDAHESRARPASAANEMAALYEAASKGFHVSESCGPEGKYLYVSRFKSLSDLQDYSHAWSEAMRAIAPAAAPQLSAKGNE